jgi:hypothetical protein
MLIRPAIGDTDLIRYRSPNSDGLMRFSKDCRIQGSALRSGERIHVSASLMVTADDECFRKLEVMKALVRPRPRVGPELFGSLGRHSGIAMNAYCDAGLGQRREQRLVQHLKPAIEAFDEGILHGLAWRDVVPSDAALISPCQDGVAGQLAAVCR